MLLFFLAVAAFPATGAAASPDGAARRYDVSYVWSKSLDGVREYRDRVASVLGPGVSRRLKVVARNDLYGLVYVRRGGRAGAKRVARAHSRLLQARGMATALPMRSREWKDPSPEAATGSPRGATGGRADLRARRPAGEAAAESSGLEAAVEAYIDRLRREGKIREDERTAWSVYEFSSGEKLVSINEDEPFEAASMVKLFIAAAFFCRVEKDDLIYGPRSRRQMERAIQHSNNSATNWLLRKIGGPKAAERILKREYPGIFQDTHIVEYIPRGGRTYRNKASPHDYSRFLVAVWRGEISGAREIKRLMALPGPDRILTGVDAIPDSTRVYDKTGSTARVCGDVGILSVKGPEGKRHPYTLIGIIQKEGRARDYAAWIRSRGAVIRNVSRIVYHGIVERNGW